MELPYLGGHHYSKSNIQLLFMTDSFGTVGGYIFKVQPMGKYRFY